MAAFALTLAAPLSAYPEVVCLVGFYGCPAVKGCADAAVQSVYARDWR